MASCVAIYAHFLRFQYHRFAEILTFSSPRPPGEEVVIVEGQALDQSFVKVLKQPLGYIGR